MNYYAIKHIPSGKYLPYPKDIRSGYSYVEIEDGGQVRLFKTKVSAISALGLWLKGTARVVTDRSGGLFGVDDHQYLVWTPVPSRKREEMQIVKMEIKEIQDASND